MAMRSRISSGNVIPSRRRPAAESQVYQDFKPMFEWNRQGEADTLLVYLPGFVKEYIKVTTENRDIVRIRGERLLEGNKWSRFREDFQVPSYCDMRGIRAKFEAGVLAVTMPRKIIAATTTPTITIAPTSGEPKGKLPAVPRDDQENVAVPPQATAGTSGFSAMEKHKKVPRTPSPRGVDQNTPSPRVLANAEKDINPRRIAKGGLDEDAPRVFAGAVKETDDQKRTLKGGVDQDTPGVFVKAEKDKDGLKTPSKRGSDDQEPPRPRASVSASHFAGREQNDDMKGSSPKDGEAKEDDIIPRVFVSSMPIRNANAEEKGGKSEHGEETGRKAERGSKIEGRKKPSEAAATSQKRTTNVVGDSQTTGKGNEPMETEKLVGDIVEGIPSKRPRLDGPTKNSKEITNESTAGSSKMEDYMTKMVKGIANAAKGKNEERELLVNMGVAVLVIVALGTYVSYTLGSSSSGKAS